MKTRDSMVILILLIAAASASAGDDSKGQSFVFPGSHAVDRGFACPLDAMKRLLSVTNTEDVVAKLQPLIPDVRNELADPFVSEQLPFARYESSEPGRKIAEFYSKAFRTTGWKEGRSILDVEFTNSGGDWLRVFSRGTQQVLVHVCGPMERTEDETSESESTVVRTIICRFRELTPEGLLSGVAGKSAWFGDSFGGPYGHADAVRPLPTEIQVVLLCSTVWPVANTETNAASQRITQRSGDFLESLSSSNRFTVICFSDTAVVWSNQLQRATETTIRSARDFLREELSSVVASPHATATSRLDRALATAITMRPDIIVLLTSGHECGTLSGDASSPTVRWTSGDCTNFLKHSWQTIHGEGAPDSFRFNVIAFEPDRPGHVFCRDVASAFHGLYRVLRALKPSSMQPKSSNNMP